jgi:TPR repeat protein
MKIKNGTLAVFVLALSIVAMMYATGIAGEQKFDESTPLTEVQAAANEGNTEAMLVYGMRLVQGEGVEANSKEGLAWLHKAADAGDTQAWYALGVVYANNMGVDTDFPKAVSYFRKGAEAGNTECQVSMGMLCEAGNKIPSGVEADGAEAAKWYQMAAEQDNTEAIWHLAKILGKGIGVEQNDEEALVWFRRGAKLGNADCMWGLGRSYLKGVAVEVDSVMAYALWTACLDGIKFPQQKKAIESELNELSKALTAEQLAQAEPIVGEWKGKVKK